MTEEEANEIDRRCEQRKIELKECEREFDELSPLVNDNVWNRISNLFDKVVTAAMELGRDEEFLRRERESEIAEGTR